MGEWVGLGVKIGFRDGLGVKIIYLIKRGWRIKLNKFKDLFNLIEE